MKPASFDYIVAESIDMAVASLKEAGADAKIIAGGQSLALLWQILSGTGFPNHFFCDSWVVGFWRADHEEHIIGLGSRACTVAKVVRGPVRAQGAAADVPALRDGVDWTWRSQECSADG